MIVIWPEVETCTSLRQMFLPKPCLPEKTGSKKRRILQHRLSLLPYLVRKGAFRVSGRRRSVQRLEKSHRTTKGKLEEHSHHVFKVMPPNVGEYTCINGSWTVRSEWDTGTEWPIFQGPPRSCVKSGVDVTTRNGGLLDRIKIASEGRTQQRSVSRFHEFVS